jgi:TolB protein
MRTLVVLGMAVMLCAAVARGAEKGQIAYSRQDGERVTIHLMNADGSGDRELPGQVAGARNIFPTWSPDGKRLGYMSFQPQGAFQAVLLNVDGTAETKLMGNGQRNGMPSWSPDGKQVAFVSGNEKPAVYVADATGANARQISPEGAGALFPFWSADGKKVGYTKYEEMPSTGGLFLSPAAGGESEMLTKSDGLAAAGANALSPDGKRLAYVVVDRTMMRGSLRVYDFAAKSENSLLDLDLSYHSNLDTTPLPSWSPDGKSVLVVLLQEKKRALHLVGEDGKTTRISPDGADCLSGAWTDRS